MSLKNFVAVIAMLFIFAQPVLATVIIGADSVTTDFVPLRFFSELNMAGLIDQTGLEPPPNYVSGVTPYADFLFGPPPKSHSAILPSSGYRGAGDVGFFKFVLSETFALTDIAIWNGVGDAGINAFDVWVSTDSMFLTENLVGSFNADANNPPEAQSFNFGNTYQGAFVRIDVKSGFNGNNIALAEVAFGGIGAKAVLEPATAALLGLGLLGFGFRRRPGHQQ